MAVDSTEDNASDSPDRSTLTMEMVCGEVAGGHLVCTNSFHDFGFGFDPPLDRRASPGARLHHSGSGTPVRDDGRGRNSCRGRQFRSNDGCLSTDPNTLDFGVDGEVDIRDGNNISACIAGVLSHLSGAVVECKQPSADYTCATVLNSNVGREDLYSRE